MESHPIWHPVEPRAAVLRRYLRLETDAASGWIRCAATAPFHLFVDGVRLLSGGTEPAPLWVRVDLGRSVKGVHEVVVRARGGEAAWVRCEGQWLNATGEVVGEVASDTTWQAAAAPAMSPPNGIVADATAVWEGYSAVLDPVRRDGESDEWAPVALLEPGDPPADASSEVVIEDRAEAVAMTSFGEVDFGGGPALVPATAPDAVSSTKCVHREGMLGGGRVPARIQTTRTDRAVYAELDLGRQVSGWPCMRLRGGTGGLIDVGFCATRGRIDSQARYVCGAERQEWLGLEARTCRYLVLRFQGFAEACDLEHVSLLTRRVAAAEEARTTLPEGLAKAWQVGAASLAACRGQTYHGLTREEPDWLLYRALSLNDYYATGHTAAARGTLATAPVPAPASLDLGYWAAYPLFLEDYLLYSGDGDLVGELLDGALQLAGAVAGARGDDGLVRGAADGRAPAALTALCAGSLNALARIGPAVGRRRRTGACRDAAADLRRALMSLRSSETGLYADGPPGEFSQLTNALILSVGLERPELRPTVAAALRDEGVTPVGDLLEAFYLVDGLWEAGSVEAALDVIEVQWARIAGRGGPTWQDKGVRPGPRPLPGPDYHLGSRLVGLRPLEPGFARGEARPPLVGPRSASGAFNTARGRLEISWQRPFVGDGFAINAALEADAALHVAVPRGGLAQPTISVNGETVWRNEKVYPNGMVREIASEAEYVVLLLETAGEYAIVSE